MSDRGAVSRGGDALGGDVEVEVGVGVEPDPVDTARPVYWIYNFMLLRKR